MIIPKNSPYAIRILSYVAAVSQYVLYCLKVGDTLVYYDILMLSCAASAIHNHFQWIAGGGGLLSHRYIDPSHRKYCRSKFCAHGPFYEVK